jgi:predicted enzyme related to lactoylglutathione lyase
MARILSRIRLLTPRCQQQRRSMPFRSTRQESEMNLNAITWFEIPVRDMTRAQRFYETLLGAPLEREKMGDSELAVLPYERKAGVGGCLLAGNGAPPPSASGTVVYLNAAPSIDAVLARVEAAGGRVVLPKTALPDGMGFFAHLTDTEGNRVGVHALA